MVLEYGLYRYIQVVLSPSAHARTAQAGSASDCLRCAQRVGTAVRLGLIANCNAVRGCHWHWHCQLSVAYNPNIASYQVLSTAPESG